MTSTNQYEIMVHMPQQVFEQIKEDVYKEAYSKGYNEGYDDGIKGETDEPGTKN